MCCSASGSERIAAITIACATTTGCTSRARRRSPSRFPGPPRRAREHAQDRRRRSRSRSRRRITFRRFPLPSGVETENELLVRLAEEGARERYGDPLPANVRERARLRARRHHEDGLRRLLPDHVRLHQGRARSRNSRWSGTRLGRRIARRVLAPHHRRLPAQVRSPLRALPESGARVDARHRRRLLLRAPRRGDRVRAPEVRPRIGRADHHVRHDEVARRDQGRRPRARLQPRPRPTRWRS